MAFEGVRKLVRKAAGKAKSSAESLKKDYDEGKLPINPSGVSKTAESWKKAGKEASKVAKPGLGLTRDVIKAGLSVDSEFLSGLAAASSYPVTITHDAVNLARNLKHKKGEAKHPTNWIKEHTLKPVVKAVANVYGATPVTLAKKLVSRTKQAITGKEPVDSGKGVDVTKGRGFYGKRTNTGWMADKLRGR